MRGFLPALQKSNQALSELDPDEINIEKVEDDAPHIEMNLALGVNDTDEDPSDITSETLATSSPASASPSKSSHLIQEVSSPHSDASESE